MTDRQTFEAMAKKWPEKYSAEYKPWGTELTIGDTEKIYGGLDGRITSDDYQFLAGEMGYVIEPRFDIYGRVFTGHIWNLAKEQRIAYTISYYTMLQAMQAGFHKVVELATKEDK